MSIHNNTKTTESTLSIDDQKQLVIKGIQQRFPDTDFKQWSFYSVGHLLNYHGRNGFAAPEYVDFFTDLLLFLVKHNLSDTFQKEVGEFPIELLKNLTHFFQSVSSSESYYGFADYFSLHVNGRPDAERMIELANNYLTGADRERVCAANPDL